MEALKLMETLGESLEMEHSAPPSVSAVMIFTFVQIFLEPLFEKPEFSSTIALASNQRAYEWFQME
jgi:hypothetical protein